MAFDIEGNQREVIDAKDRVVMRYDYDMLGNRIHQASMEAGERWMLNDVAGKPISPGTAEITIPHRIRRLRRPTRFLRARRRTAPSCVVGRDGLWRDARPIRRPSNLRGKVFRSSIRRASSPATTTTSRATCCAASASSRGIQGRTLDWSGRRAAGSRHLHQPHPYDALNRPIGR